MKEFQEKKKLRRRLYSRWSLAGLCLIIILLTRGTWTVYEKSKESQAELGETKSQMASLQARHDLLTSQIAKLKTDEGKEAEIKENFQVTKDGERVVVIVDNRVTEPTTTATTTKPTFWGRVWGSIRGLF